MSSNLKSTKSSFHFSVSAVSVKTYPVRHWFLLWKIPLWVWALYKEESDKQQEALLNAGLKESEAQKCWKGPVTAFWLTYQSSKRAIHDHICTILASKISKPAVWKSFGTTKSGNITIHQKHLAWPWMQESGTGHCISKPHRLRIFAKLICC